MDGFVVAPLVADKAADDPGASILDVCNVVGDATAAAKQHLGLNLPWLSWLKDIPATTTSATDRLYTEGTHHFAPFAVTFISRNIRCIWEDLVVSLY